MFLKNAWYVACTPDEIDGKPLGRQICGERMVFWRTAEGGVAALEDFCPHRGAPLSLGSVREGHLVCGYHGLTVGASGKCVSMPCQRVGGIPAVRSYPAVERYGFIWVWPGDAAEADRVHIPAPRRQAAAARDDQPGGSPPYLGRRAPGVGPAPGARGRVTALRAYPESQVFGPKTLRKHWGFELSG